MRYLVIVILAAACVWLFIERNRLKEEVAAVQAQLAESQKEVGELTQQVATFTGVSRTIILPGGTRTIIQPQTTQQKSNWLDSHIEKGANALDSKKPHAPALR